MKNKLPDFSIEINDLNNRQIRANIRVDPTSIPRISKKMTMYKALPNKFRPALEQVADYARSDMIPYVFQKEGPGWKQLSLRTQRERQMQGYHPRHPILQRSGDLFKELTRKSHPNHVEVIKVGKNARVEIGGSSVKFMENQMGKPSQNLPARPMIPGTGNLRVSPRDRANIQNILSRAMKKMT